MLCSSLLGKVIYELKGPDLEGHAKLFRKPWASTAGMFVGVPPSLGEGTSEPLSLPLEGLPSSFVGVDEPEPLTLVCFLRAQARA